MEGFTTWAEEYCRIFGLQSEADRAMVQAWGPVFQAAGYATAELNEATQWLARNAPPLRRIDHRSAIQSRIHAARLERRRAESEAEEARARDSTCELCGGSGRVIVPQIGLYEATGKTGTVTCRCPLGQRKEASDIASLQAKGLEIPRNRIGTLEQYEGRNPGWFSQMRRREEMMKARSFADRLAEHADKMQPLQGALDEALRRQQIAARAEWAKTNGVMRPEGEEPPEESA